MPSPVPPTRATIPPDAKGAAPAASSGVANPDRNDRFDGFWT
jgi:hypothetical protein